jgi:hypothetical protein
MRAKVLLAGLITALMVVVSVRPSAQAPTGSMERKLVLAFDGNGFATLTAQNVTVPEIFAEWARVGGSKVTNAEKLPSTRISVQFVSYPEARLVETLVRLSKAQGAGSIVAPRLADAPPTPSRLQAINILPSSTPSANMVATPMSSSPVYPQGNIDDTEVPPVMPTAGPGPASQPAQQQPAAQAPANRGPGVVSVVPVGPSPTPNPTTSTTGRGRGNF